MTTHTFKIMLDRVPTEEELEQLFEAGCNDATFMSEDGYGVAEFDRDATSLAEAVLSAVDDLEKVAFTPVRVLNDELVSLAEIAKRVGRDRETIRMYATGQRGPGKFPAPVNPNSKVRFWRWNDVAPWLKAYGIEAEADNTLAVANLALQLRATLRSSDSVDERTEAVALLTGLLLRETRSCARMDKRLTVTTTRALLPKFLLNAVGRLESGHWVKLTFSGYPIAALVPIATATAMENLIATQVPGFHEQAPTVALDDALQEKAEC